MKLRSINRIICASAFVLSVSCVKEEMQEPGRAAEGDIILAASFGGTKTAGITTISFERGDSLSVFDKSGNNAFVQDEVSLSIFHGKLSSAPLYAVYPYVKSSEMDEDGEITVNMPSHYSASTASSIVRGMGLSIGEVVGSGDGYSAQLRNVFGLVGISVPEYAFGVKNIKLTSTEGKVLCGQFRISYNDGDPLVKASSGGASVDFDLHLVSESNLTDAGKYYFALPPGTYTGIELQLTLWNGQTRTFASSNPLTVVRNGRVLLRTLGLEDIQDAPDDSPVLSVNFPPDSGDQTHTHSFYRVDGTTTHYLPVAGEADYHGGIYYFDQESFSYPFYVFTNNADGTLNHYWWKAKQGLVLKGGAKSAWISFPAIPGKAVSAIRLATDGSTKRTVRISTVPGMTFETLESGTYVEGKSGSNAVLGDWIYTASLSLGQGSRTFLYFNHDAITVTGLEISYGNVEPEPEIPEVPSYYEAHISQKASEVGSAQSGQKDGFIFWTDTHVKSNKLNAPSLINELLGVSASKKLFWGGDAIPAYTDDVDQWWNTQKRLFRQMPSSLAFPVHGNHDITCRFSAESEEGYTKPKAEVAAEFAGICSDGVTRNPSDPEGMYYYYEENGIRYIVVDDYDDFNASRAYWGVKAGISDAQMDWIFSDAVLSAPEGSKLVFIMHKNVAIPPEVSTFNEMAAALDSLAVHADCGSWNFSSRADLDLLMVLGGHHHHDMQICKKGKWYVQTVCDAKYAEFLRNPLADQSSKRTSGTVSEQAFDYVSISEDCSAVNMIRVGYGGNRTYNMSPVTVPVGESVQLSSDGAVSWVAYDGDSSYSDDGWNLKNEYATVSSSGLVTALKPGESVVAALDASYNVELFIVDVQEKMTDLSASGRANCYVVSSGGKYLFDARYKGTSSESVGTAACAAVLWESSGTGTSLSEGDIIADVSLQGGYVNFSTSSTYRAGNAVIAVEDVSGNVLWSWHIWCAASRIESQTYGNGAGEMMSINLGAEAGTGTASFGLLYQWGRKDPFPSAESTTTFPSAVASTETTGTYGYADAHPTTFVLSNDEGNWYSASGLTARDCRWKTGKNSFSDPCPVGWKVPEGGSDNIWSIASGNSSLLFMTDGGLQDGVCDFTDKFGVGSTCRYPAGGMLDGSDSALLKFYGEGGYYWCSAPSDADICGFAFTRYKNVAPILTRRSDAHSVRCIKIK